MDLHGVGPVVAARVVADAGDVTRFVDRNRFASWTGTAPLDASSGEQNRHRLSRAGNRRMNHMIHIAAISQIHIDTGGRAYYRRKRAEGKKPLESDQVPQAKDLRRDTRSTTSCSPTLNVPPPKPAARAREGTVGRRKNPARSTFPCSSTLRISHFPDPRTRRYARRRWPGRPSATTRSNQRVDNRREPS
jgi:hypothetical protein